MKLKQILALLLAACMLLGMLAGCSKNPSAEDADSKTPGSSLLPSGGKTDSAAAQTSAKYVYLAEEVGIDLPLAYINLSCISGNYVYISGDVMTDPGSGTPDYSTAVVEAGVVEEAAVEGAIVEDVVVDTEEYVAPTYETRIYRVDLDTAQTVQLTGYTQQEVPEGYDGYNYINQLIAGADGSVWVRDEMYSFTYELPADFDPAADYEWNYQVEGPGGTRLQQFSPEGELLCSVPADNLSSDEYGAYSVSCIDAKSQIYLTDYTNYYVLDTSGNVIKTLDVGESSGEMFDFCGQAAIRFWDDNGKQSVRAIDPDTLEIGESFTPPTNSWSYLTSYDEAYDFYYTYSQNLYGYKLEEQESEKVVDWMDCDIDPTNLSTIFPLTDGRILGLFTTYDEKTEKQIFSLVFLTKTDAATVAPKTVLTLACMYLPWDLRNRIIAFNKANTDYRIIVNDYSQYATDEDYDAGVTKLNTEIISGKVPDLLYTGNLPISQYAGRGILVDLLPLIDADSELSREDLMTNVIEAASINGHLYQAVSAFNIMTVVALDKVVGEYDKWTLEELNDAMTKLQPDATVFGPYYTRDSVFYECISRNLSYYVNWDTGVCSFDSQEFRDLLEFANAFPEEIDWEAVNDGTDEAYYGASALLHGTQLLLNNYIYSIESLLWTLGEYGDEKLCFIGYPSQEGNNNSFSLVDGLCITTTCSDVNAAWQFVREVFTEEYQEDSYDGLPTNANVFNRRLADVQTITYATDENGEYVLDENGEKVIIPKATIWDDETQQTTDIACMSKELADQLMELYNSIHTCASYDAEIYNIVEQEAAGYFAGQTALDEIVKRIQNRVSLIVAEKK